jgi:hypothetical protein
MQLLSVSGIGPTLLAKYGDTLLSLVAKAKSAAPTA